MITLYHCKDARSLRCLWLLEEMGLPFQLKLMQLPPRSTAPDYLRVNPTGAVPFLQDGDTGVFESAAILEYLATRDGGSEFAVPPAHPAYGPWLAWLHFGEASLTTPLATLLRYGQLAPPERRQPQVAQDCRDLFASRLPMLDAALADAEYLVDHRFTAADISVGYALMLARYLGLQDALSPAANAYWKRLSGRAAFKAARAAQMQGEAA